MFVYLYSYIYIYTFLRCNYLPTMTSSFLFGGWVSFPLVSTHSYTHTHTQQKGKRKGKGKRRPHTPTPTHRHPSTPRQRTFLYVCQNLSTVLCLITDFI